MAVGTYVHRKEAAEAQQPGKHLTNWMTDAEFFQVLSVLSAIFFPPLFVFLERGCGVDFILNFLLTCLGYVPGLIHAFFLLYKDESALVYNPESYAPSTLAAARRKQSLSADDVLRAASDEEREERRKIRAEGRGGRARRRRDDEDDEDDDAGDGDEAEQTLRRAPSYRSTATGPPAYDPPSSDSHSGGEAKYFQQAQMSEKKRGKQVVRDRYEGTDPYV